MVLRIVWNVLAGYTYRAVKRNALKPGLGVLYPAVWRGRTGFLDCDVNLHLNNAAYLFSMELARWHWSAATSVLDHTVRNGRMFLVASQAVRYRHAIPPFHAYEVRTQIIYWDDAFGYFLHQFICPATGKLYAEGLVRAVVKQGKTRIPTQQVLEEMGIQTERPKEVPDIVQTFLQWEETSRVNMSATQNQLTQQATASPAARGWLSSWTRSMNLPFSD